MLLSLFCNYLYLKFSMSTSAYGYLPKPTQIKYRKIPKISPGAYICQRPFLRGLFLEGLIYGGKFVFQNRLGLYLEGNLHVKIDWASL